jgi:hypothetical protein
MNPQRAIIGAGLIIGLIGVLSAIQHETSIARPIGGAVGFTLLLGLLAAAGDGPGRIASGLAVVGATTIIFYEAIPLFDLLNSIGRDHGGGSGVPGFHGPTQGQPRGEMPH